MELSLKGKTSVLTCGESALGHAAALAFANEGCNLAVCCQSREKAELLSAALAAANCENLVACVDIRDSLEMDRFADMVLEKFGAIDIWVNNAEMSLPCKLMDITFNEYDTVFDSNLRSLFFASQSAMRRMINKKIAGVIINLSSYSALVPTFGHGLYAASKAGVNSLTRSFAAMCAPHGIRVIALAPEEAILEAGKKETNEGSDMERRLAQIPLRRLCSVEEVVAPLVFLTSDKCSYITGSCVEISGGKLCVQNPLSAWPEGQPEYAG